VSSRRHPLGNEELALVHHCTAADKE
jgi:hypothetical protein